MFRLTNRVSSEHRPESISFAMTIWTFQGFRLYNRSDLTVSSFFYVFYSYTARKRFACK